MNQDVVAHRFALWIETLQHTQWTRVTMATNGSRLLELVIKLKLRVPRHGWPSKVKQKFGG
jgi:hypothetical protein